MIQGSQKLFCNAEFLSNMHHHQNLNQSHNIAKMVDFQENHTIYIIKYTSTYLYPNCYLSKFQTVFVQIAKCHYQKW